MKKIITKITILFSLIVLMLNSKAISIQTEISEPDATVHEIMDNTIATLAKKYNLNPCGIGMNGKFEYVEISFQTHRSMEKDEIRVILLDCTDVFLKNINSCEKIRPYLKDYPFTNKNAGIVLFIHDEKDYDVFHPQICCASSDRGEISYHTQSKDNLFRYKETYEETYEQALDIVKKQIAQKKPDK